MGDITTFVDSFLDIIIKSEEQTIRYAEEKKSELSYYRNIIDGSHFNHKQTKDLLVLLLQAELFSEYGLSMKELLENSKLSKVTCLRCLNELKEKNLLVTNKAGKAHYYRSCMKNGIKQNTSAC